MATSNQVSGSAFNYQYDRFGNRWQQNLTAGSGPTPNYSFNSNNQINGFTYDAAGNIINDGNHTYTYDAEERMIAVDGGTTATYSYDAMGRRFATNVGGAQKEFLFDLNNRVLAMQNAATHSWDRGEVYAGGMHLATYVAQDTYFVHANWLGTVQGRTNSQGAIAQSYTSLPFGDSLSQVGMSPTHFTDQDHDPETGLDHFLYRQYSSTQGRWMTPDPGGLGVVDPTNPQSWNRYAYVMNNPINLIDLVGLECYAIDSQGNMYCDVNGNGGGGDDGGNYVIVVTVVANNGPTGVDSIVVTVGRSGSTQGGNSSSGGGGGGNSALSQRLNCAAEFGQNHSIAAAFGAQHSFIGNLLGGNTVSGLVSLGQMAFGSRAPTAGDAGTAALSGGGQGLPGGGPGFKGAAGQVSDAVVGSAVTTGYNVATGVGQETVELGITASGKVATAAAPLAETTVSAVVSYVSIAKVVFDAGTFAYGAIFACK